MYIVSAQDVHGLPGFGFVRSVRPRFQIARTPPAPHNRTPEAIAALRVQTHWIGCPRIRASFAAGSAVAWASPRSWWLTVLTVRAARGVAALADVVSITRASKVRFSDVVGMRDLKQVLKLKIIDPSPIPDCSPASRSERVAP